MWPAEEGHGHDPDLTQHVSQSRAGLVRHVSSREVRQSRHLRHLLRSGEFARQSEQWQSLSPSKVELFCLLRNLIMSQNLKYLLDTTLISLKYQVCRSSSQAREVQCQINPTTISDKSSKLEQRENGIKTKPLGSGRQKQQDEDSVLQIQVSGIIKFPLWPLQTQTHHEKVVLD